jgi:hypothetical protein
LSPLRHSSPTTIRTSRWNRPMFPSMPTIISYAAVLFHFSPPSNTTSVSRSGQKTCLHTLQTCTAAHRGRLFHWIAFPHFQQNTSQHPDPATTNTRGFFSNTNSYDYSSFSCILANKSLLFSCILRLHWCQFRKLTRSSYSTTATRSICGRDADCGSHGSGKGYDVRLAERNVQLAKLLRRSVADRRDVKRPIARTLSGRSQGLQVADRRGFNWPIAKTISGRSQGL